MKTYTIYYAQGSKRRITSLLALNENHAIDKIVSGMRGGTFAETRKPFNMFKAVCNA